MAKAERILREALKGIKWIEATLAQKRKGDAGKVRIAQGLRRETTMTLEWIAARLRMGTKSHLVHLLYWHGRKKDKRK